MALEVRAMEAVNPWGRLEVQNSYLLAVGAEDSYTLAHAFNPSSLERLLQGEGVDALLYQGVNSELRITLSGPTSRYTVSKNGYRVGI